MMKTTITKKIAAFLTFLSVAMTSLMSFPVEAFANDYSPIDKENIVCNGFVSGGDVMDGFSGHISQYKGIIGETYYFVNDTNSSKWMKGVLVDSYEHHVLWWTERYHDVKIIEISDSCEHYFKKVAHKKCDYGDVVDIEGSDWSIYMYK